MSRETLVWLATEKGWKHAVDGVPKSAGEFIVSASGKCVVYHNGTYIDYWAPESNHAT